MGEIFLKHFTVFGHGIQEENSQAGIHKRNDRIRECAVEFNMK